MSNLKAEVVRQNGDAYPTSSDNRVTVPYHEEYCVRVRNRDCRRAMFMVYIDGQAISPNKFVLGSNSDVTIERFVEDLNAGRKFQWLPLDHKEVKDRIGKPETGMVRVVMWWEKEPPVVYRHFHHYADPYPYDPPSRDPWNPWIWPQVTWTTGDSVNTSCDYVMTNDAGSTLLRSCAVPAGATGEGGYSGQRFREVTGFELNSEFEEIVFFLRTPETVTPVLGANSTVVEHVGCYCPHCGAKRKNRNHAFCPFCGHKF